MPQTESFDAGLNHLPQFYSTMKSLLFFLLFGLVSTACMAQTDTTMTPEQRATKTTDRMKERLTLTDEQHTPVYEIMLQYFTDIRTLQNKNLPPNERKPLRIQLDNTRNEALKGVLTEDQYAKFCEDQNISNKKGKGRKFAPTGR